MNKVEKYLVIAIIVIVGAIIISYLLPGAQPSKTSGPSSSSQSPVSERGQDVEPSRPSTLEEQGVEPPRPSILEERGTSGCFVFGSKQKEALDRELRSAFGSALYLGIRVDDPTGVILYVDFTGIPDKDMGRRIAVAVKNVFYGLFPEASTVLINVYDVGLEREMGNGIWTR